MKESAARLTKIPSTLVLHKPTTGIDTRLATYRHAIVDNPLENILGLHEPGRYRQANPEQPFAYDKIEDMWQEDMHDEAGQQSDTGSHSSSEDEDDDSDIRNDKNEGGDDDNNHGDKQEPIQPPTTSNPKESNSAEDQAHGNMDKDTSSVHSEPIAANTNKQPITEAPQARTEPLVETTQTVRSRAVNKRKRNEDERPQRTSARSSKRPARYRDNKTQAELHTPQQTGTQHSRTQQAHKLYRQIRKSRDKLFFIKYTIDTTNTPRWYIVQAKLSDDDDETTRNEGQYTVWFYIREHTNSKTRQLRNCRYWPEVHQLRPNGRMGQIIPIRPGRVDTLIKEQPTKYKVFEQTLNLCEAGLVGPFDFAVPKHYQQEANRIAFEEWEELKAAAQQHGLDVSDIEEIIPLH